MANLGKKNGIFIVRFRLAGKEYKKSLKTRDRDNAKAALHIVETAIHRLAIGQAQVPTGVDAGDYVGKWRHVDRATKTQNRERRSPHL